MRVSVTALNQSFYISYKTHSYCRRCELWQDIPNKRCEKCNGQLRRNPRFNKSEDRWKNAY